MPHFIVQLMTILVLVEMVFVITGEMFHGKLSLSLVLLLLLVNFVSVFRLQFMYISLIVSIRSGLTHLHDFQLLVLLPQLIEITFFVCTSRINLLNLGQASNRCKRILEAARLTHAYKRVHHFPETWLLGLLTNCYSVLNKGKSVISPLFNCTEVLSSASDKGKLFAKKFCKNSNLDDLHIILPVFLFCNSQDGSKVHNEP